MALTLSGTNGVVGAGFSITPGGAVAGVVTVGTAVTISESGIEASGIGITCANINGTQIGGRRNLIINGAMNVAQRGTSFVSPGNDTYTVDRWRYIKSLATGDVTITQSSTSPPGHTYSLKVDITTADTDIGAAELSRLLFSVEGSTIQGPAKGTSAAKEMRLSFWVRSNKTGTYNCLFYDKDNSRNAGNTYTINAADTWEHKVLKIPADSTGAFGNDNGDSLEVYWHFAAGSDRKTGTLRNTAWATYAAADEAVGHNVNLFDSTSNEWYITGVQLEVGEEATDFEYCSYAEELQLCKRYFQYWGRSGSSSGDNSICAWGMYYSSTLTQHFFPMQVEMRANPTVSTSTTTYGDFDVFGKGYADQPSTAPSFFRISNKMFRAQFSTTSRSGVYSAWLEVSDATDNSQGVEADAEL